MSTVITTPAITDVAAGSEADARSVVAGAANPNAATVLYPASVNVGVELGSVGGTAAATDLANLVRGGTGASALSAAHWKAGPPAAGTTTDPGVLAALRAAWQE